MKKLFVLLLLLCLFSIPSFAQIWEGNGGEFISEGLGDGNGGGGSINPLITHQVTFTGYDQSVWSGEVVQNIPDGLGYSVITPEPSATGYKFLGWSTNADYPNLITLPETVTADAYYLAVFEKISYPLYYSYNGNVVHTDYYYYGDTVVPYIHNISSGKYVQWMNDPVTMPPATTTVTGISVSTFVHAFEIDQSNSFAVSYLYDSVGMSPISLSGYGSTTTVSNWDSSSTSWKTFIYSIAKPVMLNADGSIAYELDPDNQTLKADGTSSDLVSFNAGKATTANAMVQFKRLYRSAFYNPSNDKITVAFSEYKLNHDFNANAFTSEQGDIANYMYFAMFEGYIYGSKLRSIYVGGKPSERYSGNALVTAAKQIGQNYDIESFCIHDYVCSLLMLFAKSVNLNTPYGTGHNTAPSASSTNAACNDIGITVNSSLFQKNQNSTSPIKTLWIENLWGNFSKYFTGIKVMTPTGEIYYKPYPPFDFSTEDVSAYYKMPREGTNYTYAKTYNGVLFPAKADNNKNFLGIYTYNWLLGGNYTYVRILDAGWSTKGYFPETVAESHTGNQITNGRLVYVK